MSEEWVEASLGVVAQVVGGGTPSTKDRSYWGGEIIWLTPTEVVAADGQVIHSSVRTITNFGLEKSGAKLLPAKTVLLTSRASVGYVALAGTPVATNQGFQSLIAGPDLLPEFLLYWVQGNRNEFRRLASGSTFPEISKAKVASITIRYPPLPVQRRIVDLMTHVDSHLANLRAERDALAITRKVMLTDALAGQLADAPMNDEWVETTLEQVCRVRSSKRVLQKDWQNSGVPFYRGREISSLAAQGFVAPDLHIEQSHFERLAASSGVPLRGDLLITAIGTIGNTYVIPNETPLYFKDASVLWVSPSSSIESWYLKYWFASAGFWNQVVSGNGTTVDTLTISALSKMTISIPPLPVQRRIVDLMTRVDEQIKNLSAEFQTLGESRTALLADLLSQGIEVPSTYDSLLPKVA